jgi:hypothetical protein
MKKIKTGSIILIILGLVFIISSWGLPVFAYQESDEHYYDNRQARLTPSMSETYLDANLGELGGRYTFSITLKGEASLLLEVYVNEEHVETIGISNAHNNGEHFSYESKKSSFFGEFQYVKVNVKALTFYDSGGGDEQICEYTYTEQVETYGGKPAGADYLLIGGIVLVVVGVSMLIISEKRKSGES